MTSILKLFSVSTVVSIITGCASLGGTPLPVTITQAPDNDPQYSEVLDDIDTKLGLNVRWGGEVIAISKHETHTEVTVLNSPITMTGRPDYTNMDSRRHRGRYIIHVPQTVAIRGLRRNKLVTVYGELSGSEQILIKDDKRTSPVVFAVEIKTWPSQAQYHSSQYFLHYGFSDGYYGFGYRFDHRPRFLYRKTQKKVQ
ncbi:MAG: Slp family lipoprotein [Arenicella sp.]